MNESRSMLSWVAVAFAAACSSTPDGGDAVATTSSAGDATGLTGFTGGESGATPSDTGGGDVPPDLPGPGGASTGDSGGGMLDHLDDDFDGGLGGWNQFQPQLASMVIADGELVLEPGASTVWLDDRVSVLLWKPVAGDFMVTAPVSARRAADPDAPPDAGFRFGGLMARDPDEHQGENYVFIVLGTDTDPSVETKSTRDSLSEYVGPPWPGASGEVRICRVGAVFRLLVREDGAWQVTNEFVRDDMPDVLQVGPIAYNNDPVADLRVRVDWVDFEEVGSLEGCGG